MPLNRVRMLSPNYSSRGGARVRLIVLHTAEGALTYQSLGSFFSNPSSGVSSHTGIDDTPNTVGEYVDRNMKAWTAANANPVAVQAELCAFANWNIATWNSHGEMLSNCAKWLAEEAAFFGIPLVKLSPQQAQSNGVGVCQHIDLGSWGGGHVDCGPAFPIDRVIDMAKGGSGGGTGDDEVTEQDKQEIVDRVLLGMRTLYAGPGQELYDRGVGFSIDALNLSTATADQLRGLYAGVGKELYDRGVQFSLDALHQAGVGLGDEAD